MGFYSTLVRPLAFRLEAEDAHPLALKLGASMAWVAGTIVTLLSLTDSRLETEVAGPLSHPIGLAAGYDKSGHSIAIRRRSASAASRSVRCRSIHPRALCAPVALARGSRGGRAYGVPNDGARVVAERIALVQLPVPSASPVVTNRGAPARRRWPATA